MINTIIVHAKNEERNRLMDLLTARGNFKIAALGKDGYDALKLIGSLKPDIAILDNELDYIDGEEIPPLLKIRSPSTAIVILAAKMSDYQLRRAVGNAVSGFVCNVTDMETLPGILTGISEGGCFISPSFAARILNLFAAMDCKGMDKRHFAVRPAMAPVKKPGVNTEVNFFPWEDPTGFLSKMELRILTNIGRGRTSAEIAAILGLAVGTVRNYISSIMRKTELCNRSQMVRYALCYGLVPLDEP